ncbi:MAG: response regulator [Cyanobacteria bacterium]|nr:response regulator [Cyanobacteriota bacterium]
MYRVLIVDVNPETTDLLSKTLSTADCTAVRVVAGSDVLRLSTEDSWDLILVGLQLADMNGLDLIRQLRCGNRSVQCVLLAGVAIDEHALQALRVGVRDYLRRPLFGFDPTRATGEVRHLQMTGSLAPLEPHARERWANVVIAAISSPRDLRTLQDWARHAAVSSGAIRNWCRTARISARRSLLFARVLRAVLRQGERNGKPEDLLNIVDRRTLAKLLRSCGGTADHLPTSMTDFLEHQRLIDDGAAIDQIRAALEHQPATTPLLGAAARSGSDDRVRSVGA